MIGEEREWERARLCIEGLSALVRLQAATIESQVAQFGAAQFDPNTTEAQALARWLGNQGAYGYGVRL